MNVDDATRERGQHRFFQHPHEPSQDYEVHIRVLEQSDQFHLDVWFEPGPEVTRRQISVRHSKLARDLQDARIENIGNNQPRLGRQSTLADLLEDRATITSLARTEDSQP